MKKLFISKADAGFTLEDEAVVTQTIAILGNRGSGKTNTGVVLVEELMEAGNQVVIIDPLDVWYGLRSSADGTRPGFPITVFGGRHADVPLGEFNGNLVADLVVDHNISAIFSLRHFESQAAQQRFVADFCSRLFFRKGNVDIPSPTMVVIDEAALFCPQRVDAGQTRMVGAVQKLVRQGRSSGIGMTMIDQRAASINKDILTQLEMLVAHRHTSPQDRKALTQWVEAHATGTQVKEFLASLPTLTLGEAWFWSPGWLNIFEQIQVRPRATFDSSRTPKRNETLQAPTAFAAVNVRQLREIMEQATEEKETGEESWKRRHEALKLKYDELVKQPAPSLSDAARAQLGEIAERAQALHARIHAFIAGECGPQERLYESTPVHVATIQTHEPSPALKALQINPPPKPKPAVANGPLVKGAMSILTALAQFGSCDKPQIAVMTGYKNTSMNTYLQALVAQGCAERRGNEWVPTSAALQKFGPFPKLPTGKALQDYWLKHLTGGEHRVDSSVDAISAVLSSAVKNDRPALFNNFLAVEFQGKTIPAGVIVAVGTTTQDLINLVTALRGEAPAVALVKLEEKPAFSADQPPTIITGVDWGSAGMTQAGGNIIKE